MRAVGVHMRIANQRIGASAATPAAGPAAAARKRGAPLLTMERITYDDTGAPVELGRHVYRAETYTFENNRRRPLTPPPVDHVWQARRRFSRRAGLLRRRLTYRTWSIAAGVRSCRW